MKKTLLFVALATFTFSVFGQKVWNVGNDPVNFPVSSGIGAGPDVTVTIDGLSIHTGAATASNMGTVEANSKTFTSPTTSIEYSFINRFKFNGSGYSGADASDVTPSTNMPTQRYISFDVTGSSTVYAIGITGSSSSNRKLFVTDGTNLVGTMDFPASSAANEASVDYTGAATKLYIFGNAAVNLYYLSATNVVPTSIGTAKTDKSIVGKKYFDVLGRELKDNPSGLVIRKLTYADGTSEAIKEFIRIER
ncbi:MAG: hypothetical protein ACK5KP_03935 [Paludibacteraceae bacterium]